MLDSCILIFSGFLFSIGFLGCLIERSNLVKIILSIEIMILASTINFCHINMGGDIVRVGYIFAVISIIISGIISSIIFTIRIHNGKGDCFSGE